MIFAIGVVEALDVMGRVEIGHNIESIFRIEFIEATAL